MERYGEMRFCRLQSVMIRTSGDVRASYGSIVGNLLTTVEWAQKNLSKPGCWAYPDMLEVHWRSDVAYVLGGKV